MKRGLIVNPKSGRGGKGLALARLLEEHPHVMLRMLDDFPSLPGILDEMAAAQVSELFISSGDGTVHAVQTGLAERRPFTAFPQLALLPHGTTNMTAADLGLRVGSLAAQAEFIAKGSAGTRKSRHTLRIANPGDGKVRHGMFLGAGAVSEATRFCQEAVHKAGLTGDWATFATLAAAVGRSLFGSADPGDVTRIDRPYPIGVSIGTEVMPPSPHLLLLATTLDKLILGTRPFWGGKRGPIRLSLVPYPVPSIARWLIPLMYGGEDRSVPKGAMSWSSDRFAVSAPGSFVVDGEFFDPPTDEPLHVESGPSFTYICG
jgi:diacylglycerol kinase (ATP)